MKNFMTTKMVCCTLAAVFMTMSASFADGLADASIQSTMGGFAGITTGPNSATLNFNRNAAVNWNRLNVGSNETLNFNAVDGTSGLTVLNTVTGGDMSRIHGTINANEGISNLIISNPSGLLFDGAHFNTLGDTMLTTQKLIPSGHMDMQTGQTYYDGFNVDPQDVATARVIIENSDFNVGGEEFRIVAPGIVMGNTNVTTPYLRMTTRNGQDFLVNNYNSLNAGIKMRAVSLNGNLYILSGENDVDVNAGTNVNGGLGIDSNGNVRFNCNDTSPRVNINGGLHVGVTGNNGQKSDIEIRNVNAKGYFDIRNAKGDVIVRDVNMENAWPNGGGSAISTGRDNIILIGNNSFDGMLNLHSSSGNVIIGNHNVVQGNPVPGSLNVSGLYIETRGNVLFKDDVNANVISIDKAKNILTAAGDGSTNGETAMLNAGHYGFFINNGYTGAIENTDALNDIMSNQASINDSDKGYMNISGGIVHGTIYGRASDVRIKSHDDLTIANYKADKMYLTAVNNNNSLGSKITINQGVNADRIVVGSETGYLYVPQEQRSYDLEWTNIRDTEPARIGRMDAITYEDFNAPGGHNDGVHTASNTWVNAPTTPSRLQVAEVFNDRGAESVLKSETKKMQVSKAERNTVPLAKSKKVK